MPETTSDTGVWTNPSVLQFSEGVNPLTRAHEVASQLLRVARDTGVAGPPVDVLALAEVLGVVLRPKDELSDAQVVSEGSKFDEGGTSPDDIAARAKNLVIEYNPSRPRGRLRFSIAHEIGHICFPDVRAQTRHRTALGAVEAQAATDEWEVELLCNIIASDLLLPEYAIDGLVNTALDLDFLMELRRRWDVSTEALLRRFVAASPRPLAMLAVSRTQRRAASEMRVDYAEVSPTTAEDSTLRRFHHGSVLTPAKLLRDCVAVGQTTRGEVLLDGLALPAQAVGAPPYSGFRFPRILTLVEEADQLRGSRGLSYVSGDLLDIPKSDVPLIVAHVVPDNVRAWSRFGVGARLARKLPDLAGAYRAWTISSPDHLVLGNVHLVDGTLDGRFVTVASLVAQEGFGRGEPSRLRYDAFRQALSVVATRALRTGAEIHVPRLGAGQAGGRWDYIEEALIAEVADRGIRLTVHTLPSRVSVAGR